MNTVFLLLLLLSLCPKMLKSQNIYVNNKVPVLVNSSLSQNKVPLPIFVSGYPSNSQFIDRGEYSVLELANILENKLKKIRNQELEVPLMQGWFDSMEFTSVKRNDMESVSNIARKLGQKLEQTSRIIEEMREFIEQNPETPSTLIIPCPYDDFLSMDWHDHDEHLDIWNHLQNSSFNSLGSSYESFSVKVQKKLTSLISIAQTSFWNSKQQYFLATQDHGSDQKCQYFYDDMHFRSLYISKIPKKHVLLLIDNGNYQTFEQLELAKSFAKYSIQILNEEDKFSVLAISGKLNLFECHGFLKANVDNKKKLLYFVDNLNRSSEITNHSLGFEASFTAINEIYRLDETEVPIIFLYISKGSYSIMDIDNVLKVITQGQHKLPHQIVINTIAIANELKLAVVKNNFLIAIADQANKNVAGNFFTIFSNNLDFHKIWTQIFEKMTEGVFLDQESTMHLPHYDHITKEILVSMTSAFGELGIFGIDLFLSDLAEDVTYYNGNDNTYSFLIDLRGNAMMHPSYPRPIMIKEELFITNITYLEPNFEAVFNRMKEKIKGNFTNNEIIYSWERASSFYIVCIARKVSIVKQTSQSRYYNLKNFGFEDDLVFHRIDMKTPKETFVCKHLNQLAMLDSSTLYLSASSFKSPFIHLRNNKHEVEENLHSIENIMAYLKDNTNLFANPGLLPEIRGDTIALLQVLNNYKKKHNESELSKYIIRRYAATINGVLEMYPGGLIDTELEPSRRPWFIKAMEYPGKIVVTEPYLDAGGAGYVVSVSYTIFEGKSNALHNIEKDQPIVVVSLDFTQGYFAKLLLDSYPVCNNDNINCFLMDDRGYLIAHPKLLEPAIGNNRRKLEHITHKESQVANDILNHKYLVRKKICKNFINRTFQRFYQFNTSLTGVFTNLVYGERTKYQITLISGTNVFVGIVNSSQDSGAFCPCSTVDRLCLNCNRMEQTECECPCECPMEYKGLECAFSNENDTEDVPVCNHFPETFNQLSSSYTNDFELKPCTNINCELYSTQNECLGILGCEWCQVDIDADTLLNTPFCTYQFTCFNGILGSVTPYGDGALNSNIIEPIMPPPYSAIAPVAGAILALCIVVGFVMYCYRQNIDQNDGSEHLHIESVQDCGHHMSRFDFEDMVLPDDNDTIGNQKKNLLISNPNNETFMLIPNISSPYSMSPNYRRPNGESSDHGYSTMTPHEESEHLCAIGDPANSHSNQKRMSVSDTASINTSVSSPYNNISTFPEKYPDKFYEKLDKPVKNHVIAQVTVHRNMETC